MSVEEAQQVNKVILAERMHWTLDYVEGMDEGDFYQVQEILRALDASAQPTKRVSNG